jgi:hypothetical protein
VYPTTPPGALTPPPRRRCRSNRRSGPFWPALVTTQSTFASLQLPHAMVYNKMSQYLQSVKIIACNGCQGIITWISNLHNLAHRITFTFYIRNTRGILRYCPFLSRTRSFCTGTVMQSLTTLARDLHGGHLSSSSVSPKLSRPIDPLLKR